jgi:hypothetical protein
MTRDQDSQLYWKSEENFWIFITDICIIDRVQGNKIFWTESWQEFHEFDLLLLHSTHIHEGLIINLYIVIWPCIMVTRQLCDTWKRKWIYTIGEGNISVLEVDFQEVDQANTREVVRKASPDPRIVRLYGWKDCLLWQIDEYLWK